MTDLMKMNNQLLIERIPKMNLTSDNLQDKCFEEIKKTYPFAILSHIEKVIEWHKQKYTSVIKLQEVKDMMIEYEKHKLKQSTITSIVCQKDYDAYESTIRAITEAPYIEFAHLCQLRENGMSVFRIMELTGRNEKYSYMINMIKISCKILDYYNSPVAVLNRRFSAIEESYKELDFIKNTNAELMRKVILLEGTINDLKGKLTSLEAIVCPQPIDEYPEYDYDLMKKEKMELHSELKCTYKIFTRMIKIRYNTPIAVAVM